MKWRTLLIIASILGFLLAWIPFATVVVPKWKVQVVDADNNPCVKQTVTQDWAHYSLSNDFQSDRKKTDSAGYVVFPERTISKNLIQRAVNPIIAYALLIAHGSVGINSYVYASEPVNAGVFGLKYDRFEALPDKLIIKRCFVDYDIPDNLEP